MLQNQRKLRLPKLNNIPLIKEIKIEKNKAVQKPSTSNPSIQRAAKMINKALITSRKNPNVNKVRGRVKRIISGLMVALSKAKMMATTSAVVKESM